MFPHWNYKHKALCISVLTMHRPLVMAIRSTQLSRKAEIVSMGRCACREPGLALADDHTLCCLQCDAGEQCAVRKGARIGKLCDCPRGTSCNSFLLKCLWGATLLQQSPFPPLPREDHTFIYPWSWALATKFPFPSKGDEAVFLLFSNKKNTLDVTLWRIMPCVVSMCIQSIFILFVWETLVHLCVK